MCYLSLSLSLSLPSPQIDKLQLSDEVRTAEAEEQQQQPPPMMMGTLLP